LSKSLSHKRRDTSYVLRHSFKFLTCLFFLATRVLAQDASVATLRKLLKMAETNYPLLKAKAASVSAAQKGIESSRSTFIPSLEAAYQVNYATYNNLAGMSFAQYIAPISGPTSTANNWNGVYGSTASLLMNWEPYTFGQREAQINYATAGLQFANADNQNEIFQQQLNVINAYLDVLTSQELMKVYANNLVRTQANLTTTTALVQSGIRPSVDTALFDAEYAQAKVDLLNAGNNQHQAEITLAQLIASDTTIHVSEDTSYFATIPVLPSSSDSIQNPLISLYTSSISLSEARKNIFAKTEMPTLDIWGVTYARGSGISPDGDVNAVNGLNFQRYNYGVGLQLSVPVLQFARIDPQLEEEDFTIQSQREELNEVSLRLRKQNEIADSGFANAVAISKESPLFYQSAAYSYRALLSRYQSGLANFADLQSAQYSLVKAETDSKLAFMSVWKALLNKATVNGDVNVFLNQAN